MSSPKRSSGITLYFNSCAYKNLKIQVKFYFDKLCCVNVNKEYHYWADKSFKNLTA